METDFPRVFLDVTLPVLFIGMLYACVSGACLCRNEGFRAGNLFGAALGVVYAGAGIVLKGLSLLVNGYGPFLRYLEILFCYAECVLFGICIAGYLAAKHKAAYDKDFVIVLGCSIRKDGGLRPLLKERANRAIRFAWDQERATGKPAKYVPSGGQGEDEIISEGSALELYIVAHGAEFDEVYPEKESRNTFENMLFSKRIIDGLKPDAKVAFVTTDYHVLRSGLLARRAGLSAEGVASRTRWYFRANGFAREIVAIVAMYWRIHLAVAVAVAVGIAVL